MRLHNVKESTKKHYRMRLENWNAHQKTLPIDQVRYSDILAALNAGTWKSRKSRNDELSLIKGVFDFARRDKLIGENPCEKVGCALSKAKAEPARLGRGGDDLILTHLRDNRPAGAELRNPCSSLACAHRKA